MIVSISNCNGTPGEVQERIDLFICACGIEQRGTKTTKLLNKNGNLDKTARIVALMPTKQNTQGQKKNEDFFEELGFTTIPASSFSRSSIQKALSEFDFTEDLNIHIDYSCMTRVIYAELIFFLNAMSEINETTINVKFIYAIGTYLSSKNAKIIHDYVMLPGYEGVGSQRKPKYCLYGLGFEGLVVASMHEWIEPSQQDFLIADPGASSTSMMDCLRLNSDFLETNAGKKFYMDLRNVSGVQKLISEKAKYLSVDFDVIYAALGPKPFVLAGLLAGLSNKNLANIYAVGSEIEPTDVTATGDFVITQVIFSHDGSAY